MANELKNHLQQANKQPQSVKELLASPAMLQQIQHALPKHMKADRMARIAMTLMRQTPDLAKCEPMSFMGALMQVSQLGLEPGGALGHAYLIPFKVRRRQGDQWIERHEVQVIIGYRGMIDMARRSGQIVSLSSRVVREKDRFSYSYGLIETLEHVPSEEIDAGPITHVYARAELKGGGYQFEVMTVAQVNAVRDKSQGYIGAQANAERYKKPVDSPWVNNYDEMARKTVVRRLFKYLPVSIEIQAAVGLDEQAEAGINQHNAALIDADFDVINAQDEMGHAEQPQGMTVQDVHDQLTNAKSTDELDDAWNNKTLIQGLSNNDEKSLAALYAKRDEELRK